MSIKATPPSGRIPTPPGEYLLREYLDPLGLSQSDLARHLGIPLQRVNEIIKGKRGVTPETALLLSQALDTTAEFWLNLQAQHDLAKLRLRPTQSIPRLNIKLVRGVKKGAKHRVVPAPRLSSAHETVKHWVGGRAVVKVSAKKLIEKLQQKREVGIEDLISAVKAIAARSTSTRDKD